MWKNLLNKVKGKITELKKRKEIRQKTKTDTVQPKIEEKSKEVAKKEYPNRFLKFYYLNQKKLNKERRKSYSRRKGKGICVRCKQKSLPGIVFCEFHQQKQQTYNYQSRHRTV